MMLDVLYFAWLRERIGQPRERIETRAATLRDLVAELADRDEWHASAFADMGAVRAAGIERTQWVDRGTVGLRGQQSPTVLFEPSSTVHAVTTSAD